MQNLNRSSFIIGDPETIHEEGHRVKVLSKTIHPNHQSDYSWQTKYNFCLTKVEVRSQIIYFNF